MINPSNSTILLIIPIKTHTRAHTHARAHTHTHVFVLDVVMLICRLAKYNQERYARIGVMPRFGDASSIHWFKVEPNCTFHIINSFEDGDEVT